MHRLPGVAIHSGTPPWVLTPTFSPGALRYLHPRSESQGVGPNGGLAIFSRCDAVLDDVPGTTTGLSGALSSHHGAFQPFPHRLCMVVQSICHGVCRRQHKTELHPFPDHKLLGALTANYAYTLRSSLRSTYGWADLVCRILSRVVQFAQRFPQHRFIGA
jgi:hypothetical protein